MSDDDIFSGEDTEDETPEQSNVQQAQARLDREKAKLKKEIEELRAFKAETEQQNRQRTATEVFQQVGLRPEWAEFFTGDEVTPDAVKAWAVEKRFVQPSEDEPASEITPEAPTGFTPTIITEASVPGSKVYSMDEFNKMMNEGQAEKAMKLWNSGKVAKLSAPGGSTFAGRDS